MSRLGACAIICALIAAEPAAAQTTAAAPCQPTAFISGEVDVVTAINEKLAAAGIGGTPSSECPAVTAHVSRQADGILVRIEDPSGRTSTRTVSSAAAAAALIETWTRSDVSLELLDGRTGPAAPPTTAEPMVEDHPPGPPAPEHPAGRLGLGGEVGIGTDGSSWFGGRFGGCGTAGPTCLGGTIRGMYDPAISGDSAAFSTRRGGIDLLLTVDFPIHWERFALLPGIGVGGGWIRSTRTIDGTNQQQEGEHEDEDDDDDETQQTYSWDSFGFRVEAHLVGAVRLVDSLTLDVGVGGGWSTHSHVETFDTRGADLAGEPPVVFRGGLGLGYRFR